MSLLLSNSPWKKFLSFHLKDKINSWFCIIISLIDQTVKIQKKMLSRVNRTRFHSCMQDPTFFLETTQFHNVLILQQIYLLSTCINHVLDVKLSFFSGNNHKHESNFCKQLFNTWATFERRHTGWVFFTDISIKWQQQYHWSRKGFKRSELFKTR